MQARRAIAAVLIAGLSISGQAQLPVPVEVTRHSSNIGQSIPAGTSVRLMVMNEVTSRSARVGDRFKLRVDENVVSNGETVIPVGSIAWGEVIGLDQNGAVGKRGSLNARLLYVDLPGGRVLLRGDRVNRGNENTAGVVMAVVGFGLLGLLNRGNNAKLKAGDIFTGYVDAIASQP